jgi:hypothetical protein
LGPKNSGSGNAEIIYNELKEQGVIEDRVFSFLIGAEDVPSIITFGGYNPNYTVDEINWHNLSNDDHWTINLDEVIIDGEEFNVSTHDLVIDTGTSLLLMPDKDFFKFVSILSKKNLTCSEALYGLYACDCGSMEAYLALPDL